MPEKIYPGYLQYCLREWHQKQEKGCKYLPKLKSFALTLQFYSPKANDFIQKTFNLALPHPVQIRKWYTKVPAEPGFTQPAFEALGVQAKNGEKVWCSFMIDEMAIKKHVSWDGKKYHGYVDLGNDAELDDLPLLQRMHLFLWQFV